MKFSSAEIVQLTEIFRRLCYFHKGKLDTGFLHPAYPSEVKTLVQKGILTPANTVTPRVCSWYCLDDAGKELFGPIIREIGDQENVALYEGRETLNFNNLQK